MYHVTQQKQTKKNITKHTFCDKGYFKNLERNVPGNNMLKSMETDTHNPNAYAIYIPNQNKIDTSRKTSQIPEANLMKPSLCITL